jgi:predicted metal-dependent peptidase
MDMERKFKAIKIGLMRSEPFGLLRGVAMHGATHLTTEVPTACTDGRDCLYNPEFLFKRISNGDKGVAYVMVHEWMHKAGMHLVTYKVLAKRNPRVANMAMDYWNNDRIELADPNHEFTAMPEDENGKPIGLHDIKYRGWTIKRIFNDLLENEQEPEGSDGSQGGGTGEGASDSGFDSHDWEGAEKLTEEEAKQIKQEVTEAIRQGIHAGSKAGAGGLKDALGLGELVTPKVNWRDALRMFMTSTCRKKERSSWRRPNRRYLYQDIIMPTLEGNSVNEIAVCRDASYSMRYDNRLNKVTSELVSLVETLSIDKVHLIDWDGAVNYRGLFSSDQLRNAPEVKSVVGGGGTDPTCVSDYLSSNNINPDCVVMLTDGEVNSWGNWMVPILWAITNDMKITAPVGKTINID